MKFTLEGLRADVAGGIDLTEDDFSVLKNQDASANPASSNLPLAFP